LRLIVAMLRAGTILLVAAMRIDRTRLLLVTLRIVAMPSVLVGTMCIDRTWVLLVGATRLLLAWAI
jgi:hypothetical protein